MILTPFRTPADRPKIDTQLLGLLEFSARDREKYLRGIRPINTNNNGMNSIFMGLITLLFQACPCKAQCDFTRFTDPKPFYGDTQYFAIAKGVLHSKAPASSQKKGYCIYSHCRFDTLSYLETTIGLEINPSSSNYIDIFFGCDSLLTIGWVLRLGDIDDGLKLWQRKNGKETAVISGASGYFNRNTTAINLRIIRKNRCLIILYKDTGSYDYQTLGWLIDSAQDMHTYSAIGIVQTGSTAVGKHKFFNFYLGLPRYDNTPPETKSFHWLNEKIAQVVFSEPITQPNRNQFICNKKSSDSCIRISPTTYTLFFQGIPCNQKVRVEIQNITDTAKNTNPLMVNISFVPCQTPLSSHQIIINEIMVDPKPSLGFLPAFPYIELYNNSDTAVWLDSLVISDPYSNGIVPRHLLQSHAYIILCAAADSAFKFLGEKALYVSKFPSFNNEEDIISLKTVSGKLIHQVHYKAYWHQSDCTGGGYSLEKTNIDCGCIELFNWHSNQGIGGSPGEANSAPPKTNDREKNPYPTEPPISRIEQCQFSSLDTLVLVCSNIVGDIRPVAVEIVYQDNRKHSAVLSRSTQQKLYFYIKPPIDADTLYKVKIRGLTDCANRIICDTLLPAAYCSSLPKPSSIRFNEVMFNNLDGEEDFIEIVNTGTRAENLRSFQLLLEAPLKPIQRYSLFENDCYLYPNQYLCISKLGYSVAKKYRPSHLYLCPSIAKFPNLPASEAILTLIHPMVKEPIDKMHFNEMQHMPLLNSFKGVSLEKNNPNSPSEIAEFWNSALQSSDFATPSQINSQVSQGQTHQKNHVFQLESSVVFHRPGEYPFVNIEFKFSKPGFIASVYLYSIKGNLIAQLATNIQLPQNGKLPITLLTFKNLPLESENYLLHIDAFHPDADICSQNLRITLVQL